ncbi:MAG: hypothetical protein R2710_15015 [Acidimicrobiales bacterium]
MAISPPRVRSVVADEPSPSASALTIDTPSRLGARLVEGNVFGHPGFLLLGGQLVPAWHPP